MKGPFSSGRNLVVLGRIDGGPYDLCLRPDVSDQSSTLKEIDLDDRKSGLSSVPVAFTFLTVTQEGGRTPGPTIPLTDRAHRYLSYLGPNGSQLTHSLLV